MRAIHGPHGPIPLERDILGYPSIRARDHLEGIYALGFLHALDRAAQIWLNVIAAEGRLMEVLGDVELARLMDHAIRTFDLRRGLDDQVAALGPRERALLDAYLDGFAAGIAKRGWPLVLRALGLKPREYTAKEVMLLFRILAYFGLTSFQHVAETLVMELGAAGASREGLEMLLGDAASGLDVEVLRKVRTAEPSLLGPTALRGSNAFAVAGSRSRSGGALLMSEFHIEIGQFPPSLYAGHIAWDDRYVSGIGVPGLAWFTTGRTPDIGWTYTYGHGDNIDILIERCEGGRYLAGGEWRKLRRRVEEVRVRGKPTESWQYWDSPYGTIAGEAEGEVPCTRWTGLHTSTAGDIAVVGWLHETRTVAEFVEAHRPWVTLSMHGVVADRAGSVGYVHCGRVDQRPEGWTGAYPRKGWDLESRAPEPLPESARPVVIDPPEGFVVSANERADGPGGEPWVTLPEPEYRRERIRTLVAEATDLDDLVAISYDTFDLCRDRLLPIWEPLLPEEVQARRIDLPLFHALHHEAILAMLEPHLGSARTERMFDELAMTLYYQVNLDRVLALQRPDLLDEAGLREVLARAWPRAKVRVGNGHWPMPVRGQFKNLFTQGKLPAFLGFDSRPVTLPGGPFAPFQTRQITMAGQEMMFGPAFHLVFDMSRKGAWYNLPGGASERRFGPGYGKGVPDWLEGRFLPLGDAEGPPPKR